MCGPEGRGGKRLRVRSRNAGHKKTADRGPPLLRERKGGRAEREAGSEGRTKQVRRAGEGVQERDEGGGRRRKRYKAGTTRPAIFLAGTGGGEEAKNPAGNQAGAAREGSQRPVLTGQGIEEKEGKGPSLLWMRWLEGGK